VGGRAVTHHIILTRPHAESDRSRPLYESAGLSVHSVPLVELVDTPVDTATLRRVLEHPPDATLLTSAAAARRWFEVAGSPPFGGGRWLVVGRRAAEVVAVHDSEGTVVTVRPNGEALLRWLDNAEDALPLSRIVYPCSALRTDPLVDGLRARGVDVEEIHLYQPALPLGASERLSVTLDLLAGSFCIVVVHSPSAVLNFFRCVGEPPSGAIFAAIGASTAAPLRERGLEPIVADQPTDPALLRAILARFPLLSPDSTA